MTSKTLFLLLKKLTNQELERLTEYLRSPFFNKNEDIVSLYIFLYEKKKAKKQDLAFFCDKKQLAKHLFPQKEIAKAERKTATLLKKLEQLIFDFLVILKKKENSKENLNLLLESLNDRHIEAVWMKVWEKQAAKKESIKSDINDFRQAHLLAQNWHEFAILDPKLKLETDLQNVATRFEEYCVVQILEYACAILNKAQKNDKQEKLYLLPAVFQLVEDEKMDEKQPLIACYKSLILLLQQPSVQCLEELLQILEQHATQFHKNEINGIYTVAINVAIKQYVGGKRFFDTYILNLYEQMLANDVLITNHYLAHNHFKNILTIALKFEKIAWAKQFVATYGKQLNPNIREDMVSFCKGIIAFYEKKYEETQFLLLQVNEFNFMYHLNKETLLLKVFYLCQHRFFISKLDTFKSYLRQNKQLNKDARTAHHNFCKALKQLEAIRKNINFWKKNKKKRIKWQQQGGKLLDFLQSKKNIAEKTWLREQNDMLMSKI